MHWRRKWQPTPVFLPGESQGQGSLVGRRLWGRTESAKATLWVKAQHEGALPPPCIVRKDPRVPHKRVPHNLATKQQALLVYLKGSPVPGVGNSYPPSVVEGERDHSTFYSKTQGLSLPFLLPGIFLLQMGREGHPCHGGWFIVMIIKLDSAAPKLVLEEVPSQKWRGSLRFLPPLEMRPSSDKVQPRLVQRTPLRRPPCG